MPRTVLMLLAPLVLIAGVFVSGAFSTSTPPSVAVSAAAPAAILAPATPASVGLNAAALEQIAPHFSGYLEAEKLLGLTTAVVKSGRLVHMNTYGHRTYDRANPTEADTIYRIYSMTKPVTGVAMMMLWEEGAFQLDDPIAKYIPAFEGVQVFAGVNEDGSLKLAAPKRAPTIKDLMTHTAGLTYGVFSDTPVDALYRDANLFRSEYDLETAINKLAELPLLFEPGTRWHYSVAVDVQGRLVEILSGMTLDAFFEERIFKPLGMTDTAFYVPQDKLDRFSDMVTLNPDTGKIVPYEGYFELPYTTPGGPKLKSGGGGLVSTTMDYLRFSQMLAAGGGLGEVRLLKPETVALMRQNHLSDAVMANSAPAITGEWGFGLNFAVVLDPDKTDGLASKGEFNWGGAASTVFWIDPEEDIVAVLMTNLLVPPGTVPLREDLRRFVYGSLEPPRQAKAPAPPAAAQ